MDKKYRISAGVELLIVNCINEVVKGLPPKSGAAGESTRHLLLRRYQLEHIRDRMDNVTSLLHLTPEERALVVEMLRTVALELGEDDFQTRVGVEIPFAMEVAKNIEMTLIGLAPIKSAGGNRRRR